MGIDPVSLAIGSVILSGIGAFASASSAQANAQAQMDAAASTDALRQTELNRQQGEVNRIANEEKSDTLRKADQDFASVMVTGADLGASTSIIQRMTTELAYVEGLDLSRIESNRDNQVESVQSQKVSSRQGYVNTITQAQNQAKGAKIDAAVGFVTDTLQIGATFNHNNKMQQLAKNKKA